MKYYLYLLTVIWVMIYALHSSVTEYLDSKDYNCDRMPTKYINERVYEDKIK